jgi:hypothetical protein
MMLQTGSDLLKAFRLADDPVAFRVLLGKSQARTARVVFDFRAPGKESIR